jgi:hypothetical protein
MDWSEPRQVILGSLLDIAENSLSVLHVAENHLQFVDPSWPLERATTWLTEKGFDAAPLEEEVPHRYVSLQHHSEPGALVGQVASPLDPRRLVSSSLGLADAVAMLSDEPFYFVLQRNRLVGVVTRADLQRPSVSMVALSLILAAESRLDDLIVGWLGPDWFQGLSEGRQAKALEVLHDRRLGNAQLELIDCLMIEDSLTLIDKSPELVMALGFRDHAAFRAWKKTLRAIRDTLAHGGSLLDVVADPVEAASTFTRVREFAEAVWNTPTESDAHNA